MEENLTGPALLGSLHRSRCALRSGNDGACTGRSPASHGSTSSILSGTAACRVSLSGLRLSGNSALSRKLRSQPDRLRTPYKKKESRNNTQHGMRHAAQCLDSDPACDISLKLSFHELLCLQLHTVLHCLCSPCLLLSGTQCDRQGCLPECGKGQDQGRRLFLPSRNNGEDRV